MRANSDLSLRKAVELFENQGAQPGMRSPVVFRLGRALHARFSSRLLVPYMAGANPSPGNWRTGDGTGAAIGAARSNTLTRPMPLVVPASARKGTLSVDTRGGAPLIISSGDRAQDSLRSLHASIEGELLRIIESEDKMDKLTALVAAELLKKVSSAVGDILSNGNYSPPPNKTRTPALLSDEEFWGLIMFSKAAEAAAKEAYMNPDDDIQIVQAEELERMLAEEQALLEEEERLLDEARLLEEEERLLMEEEELLREEQEKIRAQEEENERLRARRALPTPVRPSAISPANPLPAPVRRPTLTNNQPTPTAPSPSRAPIHTPALTPTPTQTQTSAYTPAPARAPVTKQLVETPTRSPARTLTRGAVTAGGSRRTVTISQPREGTPTVEVGRAQMRVNLQKKIRMSVALPPKFEISYADIQMGEKIGEGGFGNVFRGRIGGKDVAVKVIKVNDMSVQDQKQFSSLFRKEILLLSQLNHPNILKFVAAVTSPPTLCAITEFVEKGNLARILVAPVEITWKQRLLWAQDVAEGIAYLHSRNPKIIHRDIKADNVLIDAQGRAKVCDFGLAKLKTNSFRRTVKLDLSMLQNKSRCSFLNTSQACGTPEILQFEPYNEKADVYSFGMLMWELAARTKPFAKKNDYAIVMDVVTMGERPDIPKSCPPEWGRLMTLCWKHKPDDRPSVPELQALLSGPGMAAYIS